jgi:hypothetical protein
MEFPFALQESMLGLPQIVLGGCPADVALIACRLKVVRDQVLYFSGHHSRYLVLPTEPRTAHAKPVIHVQVGPFAQSLAHLRELLVSR